MYGRISEVDKADPENQWHWPEQCLRFVESTSTPSRSNCPATPGAGCGSRLYPATSFQGPTQMSCIGRGTHPILRYPSRNYDVVEVLKALEPWQRQDGLVQRSVHPYWL